VQTDPSKWLSALRRSQDQLATLISGLDASGLRRTSYCADWSVAQVLSHLGSQAEIFGRFVDAGLSGQDPPGQDQFPPIWDAWNARTPEAQAEDSIAANEAFLRRLEGLDGEQLSSFRLALFGMDLDVVGLLGLRLSEQAVHAWDVAVTFDPDAKVAADASALLVDRLPDLAARVGKATEEPMTVRVSTTGPERSFALLTGGVGLEPFTDQSATGTLQLPAEAFVRLVYGRLDARHTPPLEAGGVDLDVLRRVFPGS
jgi:uncharacterized protein (TIGR03083 family)